MKPVSEYVPLIGMAGFIIIVQVLALAMAVPMETEGMRAFENPSSVWNPIYYIILILVFTAFILFVIKINKKYILHAIILFAVAATIYYVFIIFIDPTLSLILTVLLTALLYKFPEWYVVDITGVLVGAGASAIIGISLAIVPTLLLLILLTIYDIISVYKTKHMIALAEGVMDIRAPILFVVPKRKDYSFVKCDFDAEKGEERGAYFMGLGDAVMPTILVVSANIFIHEGYVQLPLLGSVTLPAILAAIGTLLGYVVLMVVVMKGKPQAGLPFLNTGAIIGYVIGCLAAGISVV
ncbi:MAG: presenilin family intramembrane aspartyl protease PSH [Euryarchaeota archaeon]|nr:presenilin family intramembrane aspartyl protease PSH [Euryarchaeota archaeon]